MNHSVKTEIMGVINVTPDSFSDGGSYLDAPSALTHADTLAEHGADILDLGAESSRPGAKAVSSKEEWRRLEPVLSQLRSRADTVTISIDTRRSETMLSAVGYGVKMINNIDGLADDNTLKQLVKKDPDLKYMAMHMHKDPQTMQNEPLDGDKAVTTVEKFFEVSHNKLIECGFRAENIYLDPGIGFGKTDSANIRLLANVSRWSKKWQIAVGVSRKSFIGRTLGIDDPARRDSPSKMLELGLAFSGVKIIRTHDVKRLHNLLKLGNIHP